MDNSDGPAEANATPPTVRVTRRSLVVFAGLPGAGKTTLLEHLRGPDPISVLDSEQIRERIQAVLPSGTPYHWYRPLAHLTHRIRIAWYCAVLRRPVVAHEPATRATTRAMLVLFGWLTGRRRVFVWLDTAPTEALAGQRERGRRLNERSFRRHVRRAAKIHRAFATGRSLRGWNTTRVLRRDELDDGLRIDVVG